MHSTCSSSSSSVSCLDSWQKEVVCDQKDAGRGMDIVTLGRIAARPLRFLSDGAVPRIGLNCLDDSRGMPHRKFRAQTHRSKCSHVSRGLMRGFNEPLAAQAMGTRRLTAAYFSTDPTDPIPNTLSETISATSTSFVESNVGPNSRDDSLDETGAKSNVQTAGDALAEWRNARTRADQQIVDWGRYHLQVMFVDRSHRIRSRLAEGMFARIASWNGVGLSLYPHSCGISAKEGEIPSVVLQAEARRLGLGAYIFSAGSTSFDRSDLDTYDLIVAMDISVRDNILLVAAQQPSLVPLNYEQKVRLLGEFVNYGVMSMLEDDLQEKVQTDFTDARTTLEIYPTYMSQYRAWRTMVATITLSSAGLVQFLMDAYPEDLPEYDPVD